MLGRLRDEGAGLSGGARAVIAAARGPHPSTAARPSGTASAQDASLRGARAQLDGILGTLGELITVPPIYERALEAALGGRVQDVVVRSWEDAEAAVDFLKRNQAGRATFLPLDSLRPGRPAEAPKAPGVIGLAADLVTFDAQVRPAVELALNYTLVVEDLPTARRLLGRGGPTLVTLDGEIVRPSGSVTGGAESKQRDGGGLLARARQLRELPEQITKAAAVVEGHERDARDLRQSQAAARAALDGLRARRDELSQGQARLNGEMSKTQLAAERAQQTVAWHAERRKALEREAADLDRREAELRKAIAGIEAQSGQREAAVEEARRRLNELSAEDYVAEVARIRAEAAVSAGALRGLEARARELANGQNTREQELQSKTARQATLASQQAEAKLAVEGQTVQGDRLAAEIAALAAQIEPAEARLAQLERDARQSEQQERGLRDQQRLAQARQNQADLAAQRAQDELAHLRGEIEKDLGLVELTQYVDDDGESQAVLSEELLDTQPPLPLNGMVTRLPVVVELPEGLDADVRNLRAQIARLGPVNIDALAEYQEVETRYNFLQTQSADLEQAVASLQEVITELDRVMEREFVATFKGIAARFKDEFANLFGGGSAKLMMTDPDTPTSTGIEIVARPPGKREQGLALLSGGERALTAAALIFSILKTRPTPFCVLDEVDAALDEANVGRFRDAIKTLGRETQFILVTHNRGTIEAADTIYGVSMGPDHTSTTLSLKLDGKELVAANAVEA
jgi:chromosome segregation protein